MGYSLRDVSQARKFSSALTVEALHQAIPQAAITAVLDAADAHEQRERKLTMAAVVWLLIAMNLYSHLPLDAVLGKLAKGLRYIWPDPAIALPTASAISYCRAQLGAGPLVALFRRVCRPLATPETPSPFLFGRRLVALDGTTEDVPDTPANAAYWGRHAARAAALAGGGTAGGGARDPLVAADRSAGDHRRGGDRELPDVSATLVYRRRLQNRETLPGLGGRAGAHAGGGAAAGGPRLGRGGLPVRTRGHAGVGRDAPAHATRWGEVRANRPPGSSS